MINAQKWQLSTRIRKFYQGHRLRFALVTFDFRFANLSKICIIKSGVALTQANQFPKTV